MLSMATFFSAHKCQLLRDSGKNVLIPAAQPGQECQSDIILNTSLLYKTSENCRCEKRFCS